MAALVGGKAAEAGSYEQDAVSQHTELFTGSGLPVRCLMRADSGILVIVSWSAVNWLAYLGRVISAWRPASALAVTLHSMVPGFCFPGLPTQPVCNGNRNGPLAFSMEDAMPSQRGFGWRDSHPGF